MANKKGTINLNYNLKDKSEQKTLVYLIGYLDKRFKVSTQQSVWVNTWDNKTQRCIISTSYSDRINRESRKVNKFLDNLDKAIDEHFEKYPPHFDLDNWLFNKAENFKGIIQRIIDEQVSGEREEEERKMTTPLMFFQMYVDNMHKRVDPRTRKFISERTVAHHKTVLRRFQTFFADKNIKDDFTVFDRRFQDAFVNWAYTSKNYRSNTIPTSFSVLKVWLNEAAHQGLIKDDIYKTYLSKSEDVYNIYLTEDEISRLYALDIPTLKSKGLIDTKSRIEETRDLFIVGCWTGLRQSDLNHLDKALFDIETETITIVTEKTSEKVVIPMHPYIKELYAKYEGEFPQMCYKSRFIEHLKELGRLAQIDDEVIVKENRGGKVTSTKRKKYELIKSHTARRSFATNLYLKGAPTISIMKLTGHSTEANFMKYIKVSREENAQLMKQYFK